ncbi:hypothetical protein NH340_JMT04067 [Sarcoptes scabiei]|nr:hypothetical protein NH340_JMT04067 [Sarcoptes scabiei]
MFDDRSNDDSHQTSSNVSSAGGEQSTQQQPQNEQELATKTLFIQHKRFYLDVKQNFHGRFIKVAEMVDNSRRKNRLLFSMSAAQEFRDHLSTFSELYASLGPPNLDNCPENGKIKSESIMKDNRKYFLDLKENIHGRYLRVTQHDFIHDGGRSQIAIPAQGMIEFRDALTDLLKEYYIDDSESRALPEGIHFRVERKKFYFDIGENNIGIFMRISEVKRDTRSSITIPEKSWARFRDIFAQYVDKMNPNNNTASTANTSGANESSGSAATEEKSSLNQTKSEKSKSNNTNSSNKSNEKDTSPAK